SAPRTCRETRRAPTAQPNSATPKLRSTARERSIGSIERFDPRRAPFGSAHGPGDAGRARGAIAASGGRCRNHHHALRRGAREVQLSGRALLDHRERLERGPLDSQPALRLEETLLLSSNLLD